MAAAKPNCHACRSHRHIAGDCHVSCGNPLARVVGNEHGIRMGWFLWPVNFDPTWLVSCDSFDSEEAS